MEANGRYGWEELAAHVQEMSERYPMMSADTIGRSVLGLPIYSIRIGAGPFHWHFNAGCHANEWMTAPLVMRFAQAYAEAYCAGGKLGEWPAGELYRKTTLWIVPMLNPDGAELVLKGLTASHPLRDELYCWNGCSMDFSGWKANIRGVDLNDQFPAHWEEERARRQTDGPAPRDFGGPTPLSEPEARALADWTLRMNFDAVLSLHTQGEEIYWNYRGYEPSHSEEWANRLAEAAGYRAVCLEGSDAGYKDWFLQVFGRPGFTVEAGRGRNPLPMEEFEAISARLNPLLARALSLAPQIHSGPGRNLVRQWKTIRETITIKRDDDGSETG